MSYDKFVVLYYWNYKGNLQVETKLQKSLAILAILSLFLKLLNKFDNTWYSCKIFYLRNEFNFWKVHGIMNTSGLAQSSLTLQETRSIHDSMNLTKIEFIAYIYILYYQSSINFQFSPNLAGFPDILN